MRGAVGIVITTDGGGYTEFATMYHFHSDSQHCNEDEQIAEFVLGRKSNLAYSSCSYTRAAGLNGVARHGLAGVRVAAAR